MTHQGLPAAVPLPEIEQYTDRVSFNGMHFPIGFDEERLLINLRGIHRITRAGGLGALSVQGYSGEKPDIDFNVNVDSAGTAAIAAGMKKDKNRSSAKARITFDQTSLAAVGALWERPGTDIFINLKERERYVARSTHPRGELDPTLQATFLNSELKKGLRTASRAANVDKGRAIDFAKAHGSVAFLSGLFLHDHPETFLSTNLGLRTILLNGVALAVISKHRADIAAQELSVREIMGTLRQSLFFAANFDRWAAGVAAVSTARLITAKE